MMAQTMKKLVDLGMELSDEGCNLFSEAYAGLILVRQKEWDELSEFEKQAEGLANQFAMEQQAEGLENHLAMEQQAEELANQLATEQQAEGLANQLATEHREKAIKRREKSEAKFRDIAHELLVSFRCIDNLDFGDGFLCSQDSSILKIIEIKLQVRISEYALDT